MKTDANYEIALTLLQDRYKDKRWIVQAHLKMILISFQHEVWICFWVAKNSRDNKRKLKSFRITWRANTRVELIVDVLEYEKVRQWIKKAMAIGPSRQRSSKVANLVKFLDSRSRSLELGKESSQAQTSNANNSKQDRRIKPYSTVSVWNDYCSEPLKIHACPHFKIQSVSDRTKLNKTKQLCFNFLQSGHGAGASTSIPAENVKWTATISCIATSNFID